MSAGEEQSQGGGSFLRAGERPIFGFLIASFVITLMLFLFTTLMQPLVDFAGPFRSLETKINDIQRVRLPDHKAEQRKDISIAAFTEKTLTQFPYRSPVDRGFLAELTDALGHAEAKAIIFDVIFDQPTEEHKDVALMEAIKAFPGPVVIAWGDKNAGFIDSQLAYLDMFSEKSGAILAFANTVTDRDDGFVREYITRLEGTDKLSMSGYMAQLETGVSPPERGLIDWEIPEDLRTSVFQQLPADLIAKFGKIAPMRAKLKEWLKGRIIYVGADLEQRDRKLTPMSVGEGALQSIPGVTMQAHVLAQLIDGRAVNNASDELVWGLIAGMALIGVILGLLKSPLVLRGGGFVVSVAAYLAVMYFLAQSETLFLPIASTMASLAVSFALGVGLDGFLTQRDEQFIRGAFSHYLDPAMVDELAENPDALRLGGDKREMSLIFTDIAGFTTMSEELEPEQLTKLLNGYFDGMTEIIFRHGGAVDKFIGDAVVAHFGAPTPLQNHSLHALRCAEELDRFAEGYKKENAHLGLGVTRIGVHSGIATVGNFGGSTRFDYTAIGDSVNTAARLESSNKQYGTRIGVSQECAEMASARAEAGEDLPLLQTIGLVMLKGKTRPVTVYTINTDEEEEFVWAYEAAFSLLELDTPKAKAAFEELFRSTPNDPLVKFHINRLESGETGGVIQQTVK